MKCPVCGFENENDSQFCGNCGTPLIPEEPEKKGSKKTPVIIAVVIIVVIKETSGISRPSLNKLIPINTSYFPRRKSRMISVRSIVFTS